MSDIRVLVVEDEPIAAAAHAAYIEQAGRFHPGRLRARRPVRAAPAHGIRGGRQSGGAGPAGHEPPGPARPGHRTPDAGGRTLRGHHRHHRGAGTQHRPQRGGHRRGPVPDQAVHLCHLRGQARQLPAVPRAAAHPGPGKPEPGVPKRRGPGLRQPPRPLRSCRCPRAWPYPRWNPSRTSSSSRPRRCRPARSWRPSACPGSPPGATSSTSQMLHGLPRRRTAPPAGRRTNTAGNRPRT